MLKNNYMIVFYGEILPDKDLQTVKENMLNLFHLSAEQLDILFSGKRQIVKKNIFNDAAMKYKYEIEKAGAVCHVEVEDSGSSSLSIKSDSVDSSNPAMEKQVFCPKCGYEAQDDNDPLITAHGGLGECPSCGVIISKFEAENVPEELNDEKDEKDDNFTGFADDHIID